MYLQKMNVPQVNHLFTTYEQDPQFVARFFDYRNESSAYANRLQELASRSFNRQALAEVITDFMAPFGISSQAAQHLEELTRPDAVTIVGGQQAGVLTGPLYSVHKALTIVLHAQEQRERLGVPVIPVFWVAGEDHDIDEINHTYSNVDGQVRKEQMYERFIIKHMASETNYDREKLQQFVRDLFAKYGETPHTGNLLADILSAIQTEENFTGFFVRLMNDLFEKTGLLLIDAAYGPLRQLERPYFCQMIDQAEAIAKAVADKEHQLAESYGTRPIDADVQSANLFYIHETGRFLLERHGNDFINEAAGLKFSKEELYCIAEETPEKLSNNVVTRPLMQEFLFPVLGFVGGAGELAYWALLKEVFQQFDMRMPIFIPRMSVTIVTRQVQKRLQEEGLSVSDVMAGKAREQKEARLQQFHQQAFLEKLQRLKEDFTKSYDQLYTYFQEDNHRMQQLLQQNLSKHQQQFTYLQQKYEDAIYLQHHQTLMIYDQLESELFPNGQLQERVYNPYPYLNIYGKSLIQDLIRLPFENDGGHYVVFL